MGGGVGRGRVGGVGGGKNHRLGNSMSSLDAYTVANDTIVGPIVSQVPTALLAPSMGCHCFSCDFGVSAKCPSQKQTS